MNRQRRKSIQELINQMEELKSAFESLQIQIRMGKKLARRKEHRLGRTL